MNDSLENHHPRQNDIDTLNLDRSLLSQAVFDSPRSWLISWIVTFSYNIDLFSPLDD